MKHPEYLIHFAREHNLDDDEELSSAIEFSYFDEDLIPGVQQIMLAKLNNKINNGNENNNGNIVSPDPISPPPPEEIQGEIRIGQVLQTGDPVFIRLSSLNKNLLITGAHGTGKTNVINLIMKGLLEA